LRLCWQAALPKEAAQPLPAAAGVGQLEENHFISK